MLFDDLIRAELPIKDGKISFLHSQNLDRPLVLLPGSFSDAQQFEAVLSFFSSNSPVIIVENRGHGGSWPPVVRGSIDLLAKDVVRVLNELHVGDFFVGGHSIGGMIAIEVGHICGNRVLGIISIEGWTSAKAARVAYKSVSNSDTLTPDQERIRLESREQVMQNWSRKQVLHFGGIWKKWDGSTFLTKSTVPIIEIYGDRGRTAPSREALSIPQKENIQLVIIENGSHSLPLQHPKRLASIIQAFLKANAP